MDEQIMNKINSRHLSNTLLLDLLRKYFDKYPDMRFGQALANLNIIEYDHTKLSPDVVDPFFDESTDILERAIKTLENYHGEDTCEQGNKE